MEAGRLAGDLWGVHSSCAGELVPPNEEGPGVVLASLLLPGRQFQGQSRASEGGLSVQTGDVGPGAFTPRLSWNSLRWALEEGLRGWLRAFLASTLGSSASSLCSPFTWKHSLCSFLRSDYRLCPGAFSAGCFCIQKKLGGF